LKSLDIYIIITANFQEKKKEKKRRGERERERERERGNKSKISSEKRMLDIQMGKRQDEQTIVAATISQQVVRA